ASLNMTVAAATCGAVSGHLLHCPKDRSWSHDSQTCSRRKAFHSPTPWLMAPRVSLEPLQLKCRSCPHSSQKSARSACWHSERISVPFLNPLPNPRSHRADPTREQST